jgi:hypothetical protein
MIRLFFNYYEDKNVTRKKEIDLCLHKNTQNPLVNLIVIESQDKLTYSYFFQRINTITNDNDINIICNSDIFLDETISLAEEHLQKKHPKEMYALSRWDWNNGKPAHFHRQDSQDTWIVRGKVQQVYGDFTLGKSGCDNRIAHEFKKAGYIVSNPSRSIKTYHVHASGIRNYSRNRNDAVPGPYFTIDPSAFP